ncbi:hypothetical protein HYX16_06035 [Candidatus Woesearchaeota archaeon]|nr:hypothetical protein [Candidatus Woesearchaeota archaeon]
MTEKQRYLIGINLSPGLIRGPEGPREFERRGKDLEDFLGENGVFYNCIASSGEHDITGFSGQKWYLSTFDEEVLKRLRDKYRQNDAFTISRLEKV